MRKNKASETKKRKPVKAVRRALPTIPGMVIVPLGGGAFVFASPGVTGTVTYSGTDGTTKTANFQT